MFRPNVQIYMIIIYVYFLIFCCDSNHLNLYTHPHTYKKYKHNYKFKLVCTHKLKECIVFILLL